MIGLRARFNKVTDSRCKTAAILEWPSMQNNMSSLMAEAERHSNYPIIHSRFIIQGQPYRIKKCEDRCISATVMHAHLRFILLTDAFILNSSESIECINLSFWISTPIGNELLTLGRKILFTASAELLCVITVCICTFQNAVCTGEFETFPLDSGRFYRQTVCQQTAANERCPFLFPKPCTLRHAVQEKK